MAATVIYLECGKKRVFACPLDWPGWCRSAGDAFDVVERLPGNATTDFGAPAIFAAADSEPVAKEQAGRFTALLRASWTHFDGVLAGAPPQLRKGPRGGGRDRDKIAAHVLGAETAYARKLGLKRREPPIGDTAAIAAHRDEIAAVLDAASDGAPLVPRGWPVRYATRRLAWHVLDHAWEIEDRS